MIANKKGMSAVIVTLLLVMSSIVLVGVVYVVVNNVVKGGTEQVASSSKCLNSQIDITNVTCTQAGNCTAVVKRLSGTGDIGGVRLIFSNSAGDSSVVDANGTIITLATERVLANTSIANVSSVDGAIFFVGSDGKNAACSGTVSYGNINLV